MRLPGPDLIGMLYGLSEMVLAAVKRSRGDVVRADRHSLRLLWMTILGSVAVAVLAPALVPPAHSALLETLYPLGLLLFVLGLALRWWSIVHLGRFFTVDVAIAADHRVVDTGPYRVLRHPSYSGLLLAFLGFGMCLCNWLSVAVLLFPITFAILGRIAVEEAALRHSLGTAYIDYARRTRALVPGLY